MHPHNINTPPTNTHTPYLPHPTTRTTIQRYNRAELSALIEIHREVKRRNISIVASNPGIGISSSSSSNHATGAGGGHHQRSLSQTGATAARAGLLSLSHPGAMEDDEGGGGLLRKLKGGAAQQQGTIAGRGAGGMVAGKNGAGDAMLSQVGLRTMKERVRETGGVGVYPEMAPISCPAHHFNVILFTQDEVDIVVGVLKIASKTAADCMVRAYPTTTQPTIALPSLFCSNLDPQLAS
jgi:hypothetical protein